MSTVLNFSKPNHNRNHNNLSSQISNNQLQRHMLNLLFNVRSQLLQSNIIEQQQQLKQKSIMNLPQQSQQQQHHFQTSFYTQNYSNIINHLIASVIQARQQNSIIIQTIQKNIELNDKKILQGLQIFVDLTKKMAIFSKDIYKTNDNNNKEIPVFVYKNFRQVYQITQHLSGVFNDYVLNNEHFVSRRDDLIAIQIKCMEEVFIDQQEEKMYRNYQNQLPPYPTSQYQYQSQKDANQQAYILELRQQISNLHQTLMKNDEQFTLQIQNYNRTLREMSLTIKTYQIQLTKITLQQMKIEELEALIVRLRQQKYRNEIIIQNMAKKIRNYEKQIKGDIAFLSPQRLIGSPQRRISMLNSKAASVKSLNNDIRNNTKNMGNINVNLGAHLNAGIRDAGLSNGLLSPKRKSFF